MEQTMTNNKILTRLIPLVALPIAVGLISAALTGDAMIKYGGMIQPKFAPPGFIFPIAWTILYILMGLGSYFLSMARPKNDIQERNKRLAMIIYFIQLGFNFAWSLFFFNGQMYVFSFVWLMILWLMIIALIVKSLGVSLKAAIMFIPYVLWCTFAAYLNLMIAVLN